MEARWARHTAMAERTWAWAEELGDADRRTKLYAPRATALRASRASRSRGKPGSAVASAMKAKGFVIATGYGKLKDDMVRVGHMGDHTMEELETLLEALREVLTA